ncbi:MAG: uroporphyrinogen-III synthase [archaeon]|nr:MAG: uroporphyrinogen-III synthase [archaeon]
MTAERKTVLLTRSHEGNLELEGKLRAMGLEVVALDLLAFRSPSSWFEVDSKLEELARFDWLVFTSSTGARFFSDRMKYLGHPLSWGPKPKVGAVGEGTRGTLAERGVRVDFTPREYLTEALARDLPGPPGSVLLLRADIAEKRMTEVLQGRGFSVEDVPIYRTEKMKIDDPGQVLGTQVIVFGSPSAVDSFCTSIPEGMLNQVLAKTAVCIGPVTAAAARDRGFTSVVMPDRSTFESLLDLVRETMGDR